MGTKEAEKVQFWHNFDVFWRENGAFWARRNRRLEVIVMIRDYLDGVRERTMTETKRRQGHFGRILPGHKPPGESDQ